MGRPQACAACTLSDRPCRYQKDSEICQACSAGRMVCFMPEHVLKSSKTSSRTVMELLAVETYFLAGNGKEGRAVWKVLGEFISKLCYIDKADEHLKSEAIESFFRVLHATGDQPPHLLMILRANYNAHPEYDGIIQRLQGMKEKVGEKRKRNDGGKQGEVDAEERPTKTAR